MAMARKYTTLRKKLRELEAKVVEMLTLPPETPHHHLLSDGVEQRLGSLKALVSEEIAAHPLPAKPAHLMRITEKLSELEVAFREWSAAAVSGVDDDCSCGGGGSESSLNDDGGDGNDGDIDMADLGFKVYDVPKELREDDGKEKEEKERCTDERPHFVRPPPPYNGGGEEAVVVWDAGKYYRVWATGAVLGAFSMAVFMARFSACFYAIEYLGPLTPT